MKVDASAWSKTNLWRLPSGELAVRPGLRRIYAPDTGRTLVAGHSVANKYTGELWHYIFDVSSTNARDLRMRILDDNYVVFQILVINSDAVPRVVTMSQVEGELLFTSPDMPSVWGLVGSSSRIAVRVASTNPATSAIQMPRGICTSWVNRHVVASGATLDISDPIASTGGDSRTFVAANQNQRPAAIYGVHEGAGNMLVVVTAAGTYGLESSAAATGIVGSNGTPWRILSHHAAHSFASSCVSRGRVYALSRRGWMLVDVEDGLEQNLSQPVMSRAYGPRVSLQDYRSARLYGTDDGPLVAADEIHSVHRTDVPGELLSWWRSSYAPTNFRVRGILKGPDGGDLLLCENGVFAMVGNFDGDVALSSNVATQPTGMLAGNVQSTPAANPQITSVHVKAEAGGTSGGRVYCAVRGLLKGPARPLPDRNGLTIGTDAWGIATKRYTATPLTSVQFAFDEKAQDVGVEYGVEHPLSRLYPVIDVDDATLAPLRPQKTV